MRILRTLALSVIICMLIGCAAAPTPTPLPTVPPAPTETPIPPTATPAPTDEPTVVPTSTRTPYPTPDGVAPEKTFAEVGTVAKFEGTHGVSGKAVIAGLQTLIIQRFSFDGKGPKVDIRLVKDANYEEPVVVLAELDARVYEAETLLVRIPAAAGPDTVDSLVIYCPETQEVYGTASFD